MSIYNLNGMEHLIEVEIGVDENYGQALALSGFTLRNTILSIGPLI